MRLILFLLACVPLSAEAAGRTLRAGGLVFKFKASPVGNLVYQLDCLAEGGRGCGEAYLALWTEKLGWSAPDEAAIARWRALRDRYDLYPEPARKSTRDTLTIASLQAEDWVAYRKSLAKVMTPQDVQRAMDTFDRFRGRFDPWWKAEGRRQADTASRQFSELIERKELGAFLAKAARFYGAQLTKDAALSFDILVRPQFKSEHMSATQIADHSLIESLVGEDPEGRIDVVVHELCHYFHQSRSAEDKTRLKEAFAAAPQDYSVAALGLLDEALAAAIGNGLVEKMVVPPEKFQELLRGKNRLYANTEVNAMAIALLAPVDKALQEGRSLTDPSFVSAYLKAFSAALGPRASSPMAWFRVMAVAYDDVLKDAASRFGRAMESNSISSSSPVDSEESRGPFENAPGLSGAVFVSSGTLGELKSWEAILGAGAVDRLREEAARRKAFVYGFRRSPKAYIFAFVGPDKTSLESVIDDFARRPSVFTGLAPAP